MKFTHARQRHILRAQFCRIPLVFQEVVSKIRVYGGQRVTTIFSFHNCLNILFMCALLALDREREICGFLLKTPEVIKISFKIWSTNVVSFRLASSEIWLRKWKSCERSDLSRRIHWGSLYSI